MFHKRLMKEFRENRGLVAGMVFAQWISLLFNVAFLLGTAQMIQKIFEKKITEYDVLLYVILIFAVLIVRNAMNRLGNKLSFLASTVVKKKLREKIFEKLVSLGSSYREYLASSEAVQISTEGVDQLEIYFGKYVPQFFYSLLAPLTLFVIVGTMNMKSAAVLLICVPLIPVSIVAVQKFAKRMLAKYWGTYTELGDSFLENLQGLTTLKIFKADERYAAKMDEESEKFRKVTMRVLVMQLNSISIMDLVAYGGAALGMILAVTEYAGGKLVLWQMFFIIMVSAEFFLPLRLLGSFFHIAMNGNAAADKIFGLLDRENPKAGTEQLTGRESIVFENVTFGYEDTPVIKNINFRLNYGDFVAFAGSSGCGKSTIASLIMGSLTGYQGRILFDGKEAGNIDKETLYRHVTRITHDSYIFKGTIRENLLMGRQNSSETEMKEALRKVNLLEFTEKNGGLDMKLNEKGSNLSGGQKQRLAVARALLHDSEIYIFDEASSNVDVESENSIMEVVRELAGKKTVILISHRLANVRKADRIYMMGGRNEEAAGQIIEAGTKEELMEKNGSYSRMYLAQKELEDYRKGGAVS